MSKAARVVIAHYGDKNVKVYDEAPCPLACVAEDCDRSCHFLDELGDQGPGVKLLIGEELLTREALVDAMERLSGNYGTDELPSTEEAADAIRAHLGVEGIA